MTNKKRVRAVATAIRMAEHRRIAHSDDYIGYNLDRIEDHNPLDYFNMHSFGVKNEKTCDTVGCIGGWVISMYGHTLPQEARDSKGNIAQTAMILDIPEDVADDLCVPGDGSVGGYDNVQPHQAAEAVENLLDDNVIEGEIHPWYHLIDGKEKE